MSKERYQAYRDLVYKLLKDSRGVEDEVLATHKNLIDVGLVETLSQIAAELIDAGDFSEAQQLQKLATRINADLVKLPPSEKPVIPLQAKQEADRLLQQGIERYQNSQFKSALHSWQQSLGIYQEIGDTAGEADALSNLGIALQSLGQYQKAIERYQQSLVLKRESGEWLNIATAKRVRETTQIEHHVQGEYHLAMKLAIEHFDKHLILSSSIGDRLGEAHSLSHLGQAYAALGQYLKAIDYHQKALAIAQTIGDPSGEAHSLLHSGLSYEALRAYSEAIECYQNYLSLVEESEHLLAVLSGLGNSFYCLEDYDRALDYYQQYLAATQAQNQKEGISAAWSGLGNTYYCLKNYEDALVAYEKALTCKHNSGDRFGEAIVLGNLSKVFAALGNHQEAQTYQHRSLSLKRSLEIQGE